MSVLRYLILLDLKPLFCCCCSLFSLASILLGLCFALVVIYIFLCSMADAFSLIFADV